MAIIALQNMTLVISIGSNKGVWQAVDRRYGAPAPKDFLATKICAIRCSDSVGYLAYSGLGGVVVRGKVWLELSRWVQNVLRYRILSHQQTLKCICDAASRVELPKQASGNVHIFQWVGYQNQSVTIDTLGTQCGVAERDLREDTLTTRTISASQDFEWHRSMLKTPTAKAAHVAYMGSGANYIRDSESRRLLRIVNQADRSAAHMRLVPRYLASLIEKVSMREGNTTVSPECNVAWLAPYGTAYHQAFDSHGRPAKTEQLPSIYEGTPWDQIDHLVSPILDAHDKSVEDAKKRREPPPKIDTKAIQQALSGTPQKPDDSLFPNKKS